MIIVTSRCGTNFPPPPLKKKQKAPFEDTRPTSFHIQRGWQNNDGLSSSNSSCVPLRRPREDSGAKATLLRRLDAASIRAA